MKTDSMKVRATGFKLRELTVLACACPVWKVLEAEGKTKFARACVQACSAMTPQAELLFPEITVESIVEGALALAFAF